MRKISEKAQMIFDLVCLAIVMIPSIFEDRYIHSLEKKLEEKEGARNDKVRDNKAHLWPLYVEASYTVVFLESKVYTFIRKKVGRTMNVYTVSKFTECCWLRFQVFLEVGVNIPLHSQ